MLLIAATAYLSYLSIRSAEEDIRRSSKIGQEVLEMDRGMERARRLLGDFFMHHQTIGLQKAHEQYAQPCVRQIAQVISISSELKENLFASPFSNDSRIQQIDVNLYLASAKRFADTSIEAVELISKRAAPERGLEGQMQVLARQVEEALQGVHALQDAYLKANSFCRQYLLSRQRFHMQSAFNSLVSLRYALADEESLSPPEKERILTLFDSWSGLAEELLAVDLELAGKRRDFSIQEQIVTPVSTALIEASRLEEIQAKQHIDRVYSLASVIILSIALLAVLTMLTIARLLDNTITRNLLSLTESARELGKGNMDVRAREESEDELGQLARIFNSMAAHLKDLVENLERNVAQRTAELSESEARFRHIVSDLPKIAVQGYDSQRRVIYWNRASETTYGYSAAEAGGKKLEELIIPESMQEEVVSAIRNWYENNISMLASELTLRHKDGSAVTVYSSHVMLVNSQGEKTMYCVDLDLADLKRAQAKEQKSESFYRQLFDHSSSGVAVFEAVAEGQDFIFKDLNHAGEEIEGVSCEEVLGRRLSEVLPDVEAFGLLDVFRRVWQTGEPSHHPVSYYKDGKIEGWRENKVYKLPSGEVVTVYDDITSQKQVEEEKLAVEKSLQWAKKMEAIGLMAGGVAHDLNNILSGIIGYPELLLLQLPEESELRPPIKAIQESGERAAMVVADLLTVARGVVSTRIAASLNTLVREYFDSPECRQLYALYPQITWHQILADELADISCSPVHIKKCIMNLVTNAAEAIEGAGSVTLTTSSRVPDLQWARENGLEEGHYVVLSVTDTGSGIPQKNIEHIFEPFFTKKVMGRSGTGLGLAVVWNTVQEHVGTIMVTSSDQGTTFELFFPAVAGGVATEAKVPGQKRQTGSGETILVVDDEPQLLDIAASMLTVLGYVVVCVSSGEEAVAYMEDHDADLLLLDMLMEPGINGRQTYEQILQLHPGQKAIVVSGFAENEEIKATLQLGAAVFVKKPYSMEELGQAVQKGLNSEFLS